MSGVESLRVGVGMISRGEVGLIVATVGLQEGFIDGRVFTAVVLMVFVTTLVTPFLLRWVFSSNKQTLAGVEVTKELADGHELTGTGDR